MSDLRVPPPTDAADELYDPEQLVLSDLVNRVLDKGVVISAHVTISIADVDLVHLDLKLLLSSVATLAARAQEGPSDAKLPVRTDPAG